MRLIMVISAAMLLCVAAGCNDSGHLGAYPLKNGPGALEAVHFGYKNPFGHDMDVIVVTHTTGENYDPTLVGVSDAGSPGLIKWWTPAAVTQGIDRVIEGHYNVKASERFGKSLRPSQYNDSSVTSINGGSPTSIAGSNAQGGAGGDSSAQTGAVTNTSDNRPTASAAGGSSSASQGQSARSDQTQQQGQDASASQNQGQDQALENRNRSTSENTNRNQVGNGNRNPNRPREGYVPR